MKVGILGSGTVAKTLAEGVMRHGHAVMLGTRDPAKLQPWSAEHPTGAVGSFADAAQFGDVVILAVKGLVAIDALRLAGSESLADKPVIDATNPIAASPPVNGVLKFFTNLDESLMERLQREFPHARFVKALNSVSTAAMVNPQFDGGTPTMFICGNDLSAKQIVAGLLGDLGWNAEDLGPAAAARAIEPLCMLMVIPGFVRQEWKLALKLLR